jgi:hypothetical protein
LNIPAMWDDPDFIKDLETHKNTGIEFDQALEHFRGKHDQQEVILSSCQIRYEDIVSFSRRSSFEGLCEVAGATSEEDQERLSKLLVQNNHYAEDTVSWLSEDGTWRVLDRVITRLEEVLKRRKLFAQEK